MLGQVNMMGVELDCASDNMDVSDDSTTSNDDASLSTTSLIGQICCKYQSEVSYHGIPLDVLKSMLQKAVRRGMIKEAVWATTEWSLFALDNEGKDYKRVISNLRNRICTILYEDVGIANIALMPVIFELSREIKWENTVQVIANYACECVRLMCESPKSHAPSNTQSTYKILEDVDFYKKLAPYMDSFPLIKKEFGKLVGAYSSSTASHCKHLATCIAKKSPMALVMLRWVLCPFVEKENKRNGTTKIVRAGDFSFFYIVTSQCFLHVHFFFFIRCQSW
jgi:hypothetical protein